METNILVKIKTMNNQVTEIKVEPTATIAELKSSVENILKIPQDKQRLIYQGKLLENQKTIIEYKIEDGHMILLAGQPIQEVQTTQRQQQQSESEIGFDLEILSSILRSIRQTSFNRQTLRRQLYQQRTNGIQFDRLQSLEGIRQNQMSLRLLVQTRTDHQNVDLPNNQYYNPFDIQKRQFKIGQWIDVKDTIDQWLEAQVLQVEPNRIFVHYNGWGRRWDEWVEINSPRIATFRTQTAGTQNQEFMSPTPANDPDAELERPNTDIPDMALETAIIMENAAKLLTEFSRIDHFKKLSRNQAQLYQQNQQHLGEEDNNEELQRKYKEINKLEIQSSILGSQLAPIFDRLGRMMIDMAPHLAMIGSRTQQIQFNQENNQPQYQYQVPIILTPNELQSSSLQAPTLHSRLEIVSNRLAVLRMTEVATQLDTDDETI